MDFYRCEKGKENFVGMNPTGIFYCDQKNLEKFFKLCIKNNFSILEKPDRNQQKLILDLDEKEKEISEKIILEIVKEVRRIFQRYFYFVICKRENSFGIHLHFLGLLINDEIYKDLTKYLKKKFPIVDTSPFNHFIPGAGKPGKSPYLPVSGDFHLWKSFCTKKKFLLTKNLTGFEKDWNFFYPVCDLKEKKISKVFSSENFKSDDLDYIISYLKRIHRLSPACNLWDEYNNWVKIGFVLSFFNRKDLWHEFSSLSQKYDVSICEKKWEDLEKSTEYGNPGIIVNMIKDEGYKFVKRKYL